MCARPALISAPRFPSFLCTACGQQFKRTPYEKWAAKRRAADYRAQGCFSFCCSFTDVVNSLFAIIHEFAEAPERIQTSSSGAAAASAAAAPAAATRSSSAATAASAAGGGGGISPKGASSPRDAASVGAVAPSSLATPQEPVEALARQLQLQNIQAPAGRGAGALSPGGLGGQFSPEQLTTIHAVVQQAMQQLRSQSDAASSDAAAPPSMPQLQPQAPNAQRR
jgi:hypothetical protein